MSKPADPTESSRSHRIKGPAIDVEPRPKGFKTLQDYRDAGVLDYRPVKPFWLVRTKDGSQFSTHSDREAADRWAERIGGTVEWYTPVQAPRLNAGETYDH
ncbi:hypothetical protein QDW19_gp57 [Microbacterium phage AvGardian]|uniref:hypothetical protein n=1 Tax=Microbacterium phage AvGardian TaxID=2725619 RepID=UPI0014640746|nr:hypothetical protein QDW19_gp57 [Microbacterium phage AvGardian]QJD49872.1 hypothetical protein SEA_AVGARDIAN_57 [Microbacterium phage AvGardian]